MKRTFLAAVLAATTALAGCISVSLAETAGTPTEQMFAPSVQIDKSCSGTVIYSDRDRTSGDVSTVILTAKHCIANAGQLVDVNVAKYDPSLRVVSETAYKGRVLGASYKSDLALISLRDKDTIFAAAKVAATGTILEFGEETFSVSFPGGRNKVFTKGTLGYVEIDGRFAGYGISSSLEFSRSTADIYPGSSGSALFHRAADGGYEIIGVLTGYSPPVSFMNSYTPLDEVNEYLRTARSIYEVNREGLSANAARQ